MPQLYSRVFLSILDSSIAEDYQIRHIFEDFLKLSEDGIVDMTRNALSRRLNIPEDKINEAIARLEAPDPHSRDPRNEGRRLERLDDHRDWGWRILNWEDYEKIKDRAAANERLRRHRANKKAAGNGSIEAKVPGSSFPVSVAEAIQFCSVLAPEIPHDMIEIYFHEANAAGGVDYSGKRIQSWVSHCTSLWRKFGRKLPGMADAPYKKKVTHAV